MWNAFLGQRKAELSSLLDTTGHLNAAGWQLAAELFDSFFDKAVADYNGERSDSVITYPTPANGELKTYQFSGNRVEIVGSGPLDGRITARIDGLEPNAINGCWQTSRTTNLDNVPDWPAIRQVTFSSTFNQAETWIATVTHLNADQSDFDFTLVGSKTGPDGQGRANSDFTSLSGRVRICSPRLDDHLRRRSNEKGAAGRVPPPSRRTRPLPSGAVSMSFKPRSMVLHKSQAIKVPSNISLMQLPPRSPELNPEETSGSSRARIGYQTASSNPSMISSTTATMPGTC